MRARRTDANLTTIVDAYRALGARVYVNNDALCDCVVQYGGVTDLTLAVTDLVECKDGRKSPSRRKLTPNQEKVHDKLMIRIVLGVDQVAEHVAAMRRKQFALMAAKVI